MGLSSDSKWTVGRRRGLIALWLGLVLLGISAAPVLADATINVNTTNGASTMGDGFCSLPEAVSYSDGTEEPDCAPGTASGTTTIELPANATGYTIPSTLSISKDTTIDGDGATSTTISGGGKVQVLNIASTAQVSISGVTISGGLSDDSKAGCSAPGINQYCPEENGLPGGGIANAGTLTLQSSVLTANSTSPGVPPASFFLDYCSTYPNCEGRVGNSAGSGGDGGGIFNSGQITLTDSTISDNAAGPGGDGTGGATGTGSDASEGEPGGFGGLGGDGGGIYNTGEATLTDSTISDNTAGNGGNGGAGSPSGVSDGNGGAAGDPGSGGIGGGIANLGTLTINDSTVADNATGVGGNGASGGAATGGGGSGRDSVSEEGGEGGGIVIFSSQTTTLANSTIAGNTASSGGTGGSGPGASGAGGGISQADGLVALTFVTVAGNAAGTGGGIDRSGGSMTETDSIVASNSGAPARNCGGSVVTDDGNNLVFGDNSCPGTSGDPELGPLASNGGPTQTMALQAGSAAIDLVPINDCPFTTDQRGVTRPQGPACDAGAYELAVSPPGGGGSGGGGSSTSTTSNTAANTPLNGGSAHTGTPKPLTEAQKLAKAITACKKLKTHFARAKCVAAAKKRYTTKKTKPKRHR